MRRVGVRLALIVGVVGLSAAATYGQVLTARSSTLNYNYVFGAGADSHTGNDNIPDTNLLASDMEAMGFADSTSGVLPGGTPYSAGAACDLAHEYAISGAFPIIRSIHASGSTQVDTSISGAGIANMNSSNPGNRLLFNFDLAAPLRYRLTGSITLTQPSSASYVAMQRFDGITWAQVHNTLFLPGGQGALNYGGTLTPGSYRIDAALGVSAFGSASNTGTYQYAFTAQRRGDMNCDGRVDGLDVQAFVVALLNPAGYPSVYPECDPLNGDMDASATVDSADAAPFVQCVLSGGCD